MRTAARLLARAVKFFLVVLAAVLVLIIALLLAPLGSKEPLWGVNFSSEVAKEYGLDWQEAYLAILRDLRPSAIRISAYWDSIEFTRGTWDFSELDWQMDRAQDEHIPVIMVIGMKVLQWPECHIPSWAWTISVWEREAALRAYMRKVVERYRGHPALWRWQVENEPRWHFGICPPRTPDYLGKEIGLISARDGGAHPIMVSFAFESLYEKFPLFPRVSDEVQIVATNIYTREPRHQYHPPQSFLFMRVVYRTLSFLFPGKKLIVTELQAEPWGAESWEDSTPITLPEHDIVQELTRVADEPARASESVSVAFSPEDFAQNILDAHNVGFSEYYLWGAEYWYALRQKGDSRMWDIARDVFHSSAKSP